MKNWQIAATIIATALFLSIAILCRAETVKYFPSGVQASYNLNKPNDCEYTPSTETEPARLKCNANGVLRRRE